jgi:trk system potassium uptake protein
MAASEVEPGPALPGSRAPRAPGVPSGAPRAEPRRAPLAREWVLLGVLLSVLAVDGALSMRATLSVSLLTLLTLLVVPWSVLVLGGGRGRPAEAAGFDVWAFRIGLLALGAVVLGAKWWLWWVSRDGDPSHFVGSSRSYGVALALILAIGSIISGLRFSKLVTLVADHPARLIALSFSAAGLLGGLLLSLPVSMQRVHELSLLDNVFMAFSAVCVTGLSVNNLASTYTLFGQGVLCVLIQVGGLGIMVFSAAIGVVTGQRMRVKSSAVLAEIVDTESLAHLRRVVLAIVVSTFIIEGVAAVGLYLRFSAYPELFESVGGAAAGERAMLWAAVFHAVSAFCNAGFSSIEAGLVPFVADPAVMFIATALIVLGGIGFPVIHELAGRAGRWFLRRRQERLSLHSRIALRATAGLLVGMTGFYLLLEWTSSLAELGWFERVYAAIFQAASCRTAGFNVIDIGAMRPASLMLTCVAMFVGACPGSCGGGVKTTTVAVLFAGLRSELEGRPAYLLNRSVAQATIRKAIGVAFLSLGMLSVGVFLLLLVETHPPLELAFEAFSAFSTTGLSTGITPELSIPGKLIIISAMYIGRIGPLTLALAISIRAQPLRVQLPSERVLIG